jgi:multidrug efflux pump
MLSQLLTLYTTPVVYLSLDRLRSRVATWRARRGAPEATPPAAAVVDGGSLP